MGLSRVAAAASVAAVVAAGIPPEGGWPFKHLVIFMQENRAFDHYYGSLQGIRGFNNRAVHPLKSGLPSWYQPSDAKNASAYQLPFLVNTTTSNAQCMPAPAMAYASDIGILNEGRLDSWNTARDMGLGPAYWGRYDLPYYYALLDGFTVGDQYHQSTYTCTNPNRMMLFTGSNGLSVGQPAVLDNTEPAGGYTWPTAGEILQEAGIDWKVLKMEDDFDDNAFAWFKSYKDAAPGNPLFDRGMANVDDLVASFGQLMDNGTLPQVTWIVGPESLSEHATWHPSAGEALTSRLLAQLQTRPDVYKETVTVLNYDEGGQFNDYHLTPNPPSDKPGDGASTVTTVGEIIPATQQPIGPGFRVPLVLISPWSRGNAVVSQTMDHTSVLRFIEERFNVTFPTISPWRRAMMGSLSAAFDWASPDYSWPSLPDTANYTNQSNVQCDTLPPVVIPAKQTFPAQEPGVRVSRALPYTFLVSDAVTLAPGGATLSLNVTNAGGQGAAFSLLDVANLAAVAPRKYGVEAGKALVDGAVPLQAGGGGGGGYFLALHGPNGFVRTFLGDVGADGGLGAALAASLRYDEAGGRVVVALASSAPAGQDVTVTLVDNAYGASPTAVPLPGGAPPGTEVTAAFAVCAPQQGCWYDVTASVASPASGGLLFARRFMGRMETGVATISDPAMSAGVPGYVPLPHAFPTAEAWHAAMDAAFPVGATGSRATRAQLAWDGAGAIAHPDTAPHLRVVPRHGAFAAAGGHKDALWHWEPTAAGGEL